MLQQLNTGVASLVQAGLGVIAVVLFVVLYAATEIGFRIAGSHVVHGPADEKSVASAATLTAGMLGLVAFMLGLTINFAQNRYETRRQEVVVEANTIGTAWLRARLVGGVEGETVASLIADYTKVRLEYTGSADPVAIPQLLTKTNALQTEIWRLATISARASPTPVMAGYIASLNDMFDASLSQRFAFDSRVPLNLTWMLLAGSVLALGALGYQFGLAGKRQLAMTALLVVMWVGAMVLIIDFNQPRLGNLRVDTLPLEWTLQGFQPSK